MEKPIEFEEQNQPQHPPEQTPDHTTENKKKKIIAVTVIAVIVTALVVGGIVFALLNGRTETSSNATADGGTTNDATTGQTATDKDVTTETSSAVTAKDTCGLTKQVTQGPYYVTGTGQLTSGNLNYDNLSGNKIKVQGYVYAGATGTTPVAGAKVDVWHADDTGNYHPNSNGAATKYTSDQISLRGYVTTDAKGYYEYYTIYPGEYSGRTRHIHTNTTADGYKGVITQLIVPSLSGDQMTAAQDNIAQSLPECNQVTFTTVNGVATTAYNYRLSAN
jgi:protocatechuate 3,4-dioxygenase beta subunit